MHHGQNVDKCFVKNVMWQECLVKQQYTKQQNSGRILNSMLTAEQKENSKKP